MSFKSWGEAHENEINGTRSLIVSALAFSLMTLCVKKLEGRIPIAELIMTRGLISLVITWIMMKKLGVSAFGNNKKILLLRGLIGTGALFCIFKALNHLPLSTATVIQYTYPTFTTLLAFLILGEKLKKRIIIALILGWLGIKLVIQPIHLNDTKITLPLSAIAVALIGAMLTSLAYVIVRKLSKSEHSLVIVHYFPLIAVPICLPFVILNPIMPIGFEWAWLLGIGVFTQIGQIYITKGLRLLPAGQASAINYSQVFFGTGWGIIFFSEAITPNLFIGSICVLGATLISLSAKVDLDLPLKSTKL